MMSKPAIQQATARPSRSGAAPSSPVTASHAPTGASPIVSPSAMWQSHVYRLVKG